VTDNKATILAIDDSPEILVQINEILSISYNVLLAKSANAATTILSNNKIDFILLDINMPGLNGFDFLSFLKEKSEFREIPVVVISSNSQLMNVSKAVKLGALGYIVKPLNAVNLRDKIYQVFLEQKIR